MNEPINRVNLIYHAADSQTHSARIVVEEQVAPAWLDKRMPSVVVLTQTMKRWADTCSRTCHSVQASRRNPYCLWKCYPHKTWWYWSNETGHLDIESLMYRYLIESGL